jgi:hypothetical protein
MNELEHVLRRLERIENLRATAAPGAVLDELRALVPEAEALARGAGSAGPESSAQKLREEVEGMR